MRLLPRPTPETREFWDGTARGELRMQFCVHCERFYFYPRLHCRYCASVDVEWRTMSGGATLRSYVIDQRTSSGEQAGEPRVIAIVALDEGVQMTTNIVGLDDDPPELPLDARLRLDFLAAGEHMLPVFRLVESP